MPSRGFSSGDEIVVAGWAATSSACAVDIGAAPWACFEWEDVSINPNVLVGPVALQIPSNQAKWSPTTFEFIAEVAGPASSNYNNAEYNFSEMLHGFAFDYNGTLHNDSGNSSATDPYAYTQGNAPSGDQYSTAEWNNGLITPADDPFWLFEDNEN